MSHPTDRDGEKKVINGHEFMRVFGHFGWYSPCWTKVVWEIAPQRDIEIGFHLMTCERCIEKGSR